MCQYTRNGWVKQIESADNTPIGMEKRQIPLLKPVFSFYGEYTDEGVILNKCKGEKSWNDTDEGIKLEMRRIPESGFFKELKTLTIEDVPDHLKEYVTNKQIEEYNKSIPHPDRIKLYDRQMHYDKSIKENGVLLRIGIENMGTGKATDIYADIDFPDAFIVLDKDDAENMKPVPYPKIPKNPIDEAEKKFRNGTIGFSNSMFEKFFEEKNPASIDYPDVLSQFQKVKVRNNDWNYKIEGKHIRIKINSLIHTYIHRGTNIYIVPTKVGDFTIPISIICSEITEPVTRSLVISVIEEEKVKET